MNRQSLNRSIGLAMSALQQARANKCAASVIEYIRSAVRLLNKARAYLKVGNVFAARLHAAVALADIRTAIALR